MNAPRFFSPVSSEATRVHTRPRTVDDLEENNSDASTDITTQTSERARRSVCAILSACASNMRDINWNICLAGAFSYDNGLTVHPV
jgi:hypothetical protein